MRNLVIFMGVNGTGKSTLAEKLAHVLGPEAHLDSERRAFDRNLLNETDERVILKHCENVITAWLVAGHEWVIVDRWYETYYTDGALSLEMIDQIEHMILDNFHTATWINLVLDDDVNVFGARLKHTKENRPAEWWDPMRGSIAERAARDQDVQRKNCFLGTQTKLAYCEINTTAMDWATAFEVLTTRLGLLNP